MSQAAQDAAEPLLQQSVDSPDPELVIDALDDDEEDDFLQPPPESELPLLNGRSYTQPPQDPDTFWTTSMAMSKSILGAGMMVIPRIFGLLGAVTGITFLCLVGGMTWFTISALFYAAEKTGKTTYASVVRLSCGRASKWILLAAVIANCFGLMVAYMVVFGDVLVGFAPQYNGVLHELLPDLDPATHWFMRRPTVLGGMTVVLLAPLTLAVPLEALGPINALGVGSVVVFALTTLLLAIAGILKGEARAIPLWPNWSGLGDNPAGIAASVVAMLPVILNADACHQAVFPIMPLLRPYTRARMNRVAGASLTLCNVLYIVMALSCVLTFGADVDADVLTNMNADGLSPLVGPVAAVLIAYVVRLLFLLSLVGSYAMAMHPLRHCVLEVILGKRYHQLHRAEEHALFVPLTVALLVAIWATAVLVPGIWLVMSLVGSVAATLMGFIFPGAVVLATMIKPKPAHSLRRVAAYFTIAVGAFLFVNGFSVFWQ